MINLESITQFILPLLLSYFAYLYGRKKDEAEIKKLEIESKNLGIQARKLELEADQKEIEAEKSEIDVMYRTVEFYKSKMAEMLDEIETLKNQIGELKTLIEKLLLNQCVEDNCKTAIEYKKILTKREARKKYKH